MIVTLKIFFNIQINVQCKITSDRRQVFEAPYRLSGHWVNLRAHDIEYILSITYELKVK